MSNYPPPPSEPINGLSGNVNSYKTPLTSGSRYQPLAPVPMPDKKVQAAIKSSKLLSPTGLPAPLGPVKGVTYTCSRGQGDDKGRLILSWASRDRDQWRVVLERVRTLPARSFNPATKLWDVPDKPAYVAWLIASVE